MSASLNKTFPSFLRSTQENPRRKQPKSIHPTKTIHQQTHNKNLTTEEKTVFYLLFVLLVGINYYKMFILFLV